MRYLSVCSGIGTAELAFGRLGWESVAVAEVDPFACAVLAQRFPNVPNVGDFTTIKGDEFGPIDLLIGGPPCQDFSVAGLRAGLSGERGGLTIEFVRLAERLRIAAGLRWVIFENVPGLLSADKGQAFGTFLGAMAERGFRCAYRVLDAQHFGVPQRRRRVYALFHIGDWRGPAAVLFERDSLPGNSDQGVTPRQDAPALFTDGTGTDRADSVRRDRSEPGGGEGPARAAEQDDALPLHDGGLDAGARDSARADTAGGSGGPQPGRQRLRGYDAHALGNERVSPSLTSSGAGFSRVVGTQRSNDVEALVVDTAGPLLRGTDSYRNEVDPGGYVVEHVIGPGVERGAFGETAHALRAAGHDASEDGTGRGTPLVVGEEPHAFALRGRDEGAVPEVHGDGDTADELRAASGGSSRDFVVTTFKPAYYTRATRSGAPNEDVAPTLHAHTTGGASGDAETVIAFQDSQSGAQIGSVHATLDANMGSRRRAGVIVDGHGFRSVPTGGVLDTGDVMGALTTGTDPTSHFVVTEEDAPVGFGLGSDPGITGEDVSLPLTTRKGDPGCVAFSYTNGKKAFGDAMGDVSPPLRGAGGTTTPAVAHSIGFNHKQNTTQHDDVAPTMGTTAQPAVAFSSKDHGADAMEETAPTLRLMNEVDGNQNGGGQLAVAFDAAQVTHPDNRANPRPGDPSPPLASTGQPRVITRDDPRDADPRLVVRRLMPIECERLQGLPIVEKYVTLDVCLSSEQRANDALAGSENLSLPNNASRVVDRGASSIVGPVEARSNAPLPECGKPADVDVRIDLEQNALVLRRSGRELRLSASNVGVDATCSLPMRIGNFARLGALMISTADLITDSGRVASPTSGGSSSVHYGGSASVLLCGRSIADIVRDAEASITTVTPSITSTTSRAGLPSPNDGWTLRILCCYVLGAIASFIPDAMCAASSFSVRLCISGGWTNIADPRRQHKPAADQPRYHALGNGFAEPVIEWLGEGIDALDAAITALGGDGLPAVFDLAALAVPDEPAAEQMGMFG